MYKIFCPLLLLIALANPCRSQVIAQDSLAVYDLFFTNEGGIPNGPLSTWPGITITGNRVTAIYMDYAYSNTIPSSISNLSALKKLTVMPCRAMGCSWAVFSFPASFGTLDSLEEIYVNDVSWNDAAISMAPLFTITSLKVISLSSTYSPFGSELSGDIPADISNLVNLEKLYLGGNAFSAIPPAIFSCPKLEVVDFSYSWDMRGGIPGNIGNCRTLKSLNLYGCELNGTIPASIGNCTELRYFDATGMSRQGNPNTLIGEIPATIVNCSKLSTFKAYGQWYGANPFFDSTSRFQLLDTLVLNTTFNQTSNTLPPAFGSLPHLTYLSLSGDGMIGPIPAALGNSTTLKYLSLVAPYFTGSIPASIGNISTLTDFYIGGNNITGGIPASLGNLSNLKTLKISCPNIGGAVPASLNNLTQLQALTVSSCSLSGTVPLLNNVPASASVDLSSNKFTFDGMEAVKQHFTGTLVLSPQPNLSIRYNNIRLSVNAGGTLANNTYKWYRNGSLYRTVTGDSILVTAATGTYYVVVTNSVVSTLTLTSNSIYVPVKLCPPAASTTLICPYSGPYQWQMDNGTGYVNIADNANFSGTTSQILQLTNIPSSWTGYKFRCSYSEFRIVFELSWTGAISTAWEYYGNWGNCGAIPDANTDVVIKSGNVVVNANTTIHSLTLAPGATITVSPGVTLTILH